MLAQTLHKPAVAAHDADHLAYRDFQRIAELIGREVGIKLPASKRLMVEGRLRKRMRTLGQVSFDTYCGWLFREHGIESELPHLIDAVTTNKTDFFREPEHYEFLERSIVPALVAARGRERLPLLKIWSAASSTGAEAYSAAMVLADMAATRHDFRFAVLGTDISNTVLQQARRAVYTAEMVAPVPPKMRARYVMHAKKPGQRPDIRIAPEIRRLVQFARLNLMDAAYPFDRDVDVIFLRNVLIYFERVDQEKVIARLLGHLRTGGYLILGHSESMIGASVSVEQVFPAVFRKQ